MEQPLTPVSNTKPLRRSGQQHSGRELPAGRRNNSNKNKNKNKDRIMRCPPAPSLSKDVAMAFNSNDYFDGIGVFQQLCHKGYFLMDDWLKEEPHKNFFLEAIYAESRKIFLERRFGEDGKLAGNNGDDVLDHRKRSDLTFTLPWNDKHVMYHCLPSFQRFICVLKETLVPALEDGLKKFKDTAGPQEKSGLYWQCCKETNCLVLLENPSLSCYPRERNAYFRRHLDSHYRINNGIKNMFSPVIDKRKLTVLFYLNPDWNLVRDGGALRMWTGPESFPNNLTETKGEVLEVAPLLNRLLIFWSDAIPHEVHPTSRDRYATTLWLAEGSQ